MDTIKLNVLERTEMGNGPSRRLRVAGQIPAVIYGKSEASPVSIDLEEFRIAVKHGHNAVFELVFGQEGAKKGKAVARHAVVKEMQFHPVRRNLLHVDLYEVDLKVEIEASVGLELVGEAAGIRDGGIVDWEHREVIVRALPSDMPESLELDVSELLVGHHLTVGDIKAPGIAIVDDPETVIVTILPPRVQEEAAAGGEEVEPEVVGQAKSEE
jgi:large subunit ribosomal protein L25